MLGLGRFSKFASVAALVGAMSVGSASAVTVMSIGDAALDDSFTVNATITCELGCRGWVFDGAPNRDEIGDGSWSGDYASLFNSVQGQGGSSLTNYLPLINAVLGDGSFVLGDLTRTDVEGSLRFDGDPDGTISFTTDSRYFFMTMGENPRIALFENFALGNTITFTKGEGTGLSHITEVGVIPLPAAGWLLLTALGGMAVMRRRRKEV